MDIGCRCCTTRNLVCVKLPKAIAPRLQALEIDDAEKSKLVNQLIIKEVLQILGC